MSKKYPRKQKYEGLDNALIPRATEEDEQFFRYFNSAHQQKNNWEISDTATLVRLCQQYVLRAETLGEVRSGGKLLETGRSGEKGRSSYVKNPLISVLLMMNQDILAMEKELMLTPKARKASAQKKQNEGNRFAELHQKKEARQKPRLVR